jgi:hypothetical protein
MYYSFLYNVNFCVINNLRAQIMNNTLVILNFGEFSIKLGAIELLKVAV